MNFIALDVETANPNLSSICQVGVVTFTEGRVTNQWQTLINPEDWFDDLHVATHKITENMVKTAPTFPGVASKLRELLGNQVVIAHTPFDQGALSRAIERYSLPGIECTWLDTARVARRAWPQFRQRGYNLPNLAREFGITFEHHIAQEDARAAGEVLLRAIVDTGMSLQDWLVHAYRRIGGSDGNKAKFAQEGNPDGILFGEAVVFTGALSITRRQAAELAAMAGCTVQDGVNKETTLLVVGNQDIRRLAGSDKSSKHRKAEDMISKGHNIRILGESDFISLVS